MPPKKRMYACATVQESRERNRQQLNELASKMKAERQKIRRSRQRDECSSKRHTFLPTVMLLLYFFNNYSVDLSIDYWEHTRKRKKLGALPRQRCATIVEDLFLNCSEEHLVNLADPNTTPHPYALQTAKHFCAKRKLKEWVTDLNRKRGLAPSSRLVARRYNLLRQDVPFVFRHGKQGPELKDPSIDVTARATLHRWRRDQGLRHGAVRILDYIPLEDMRSKAHNKFIKNAI